MISRVVSVGIFLVALLGSGILFSEIKPFTGVPAVQEKFAWFAAHANEYDTLFVGTSRVYRGIDPVLFDKLTAAAGVPTRSFNFGIDAMMPPEDAYVLEHIADLRPKQLRWVFIESGTLRAGVGYGGEENVRSLHWHDTRRTVLALRALLAPTERRTLPGREPVLPADERRSVTQAVAHLRLWLTRTLNAGRGAQLLRLLLAPGPRVHLSTVIGRARNGYMPPGDNLHIPAAALPDYERRFAERLAEPAHISFLDRDAQSSLDTMLTRLRALGARPILVIPPSLAGGRPHPQPGCPAPVLDYGEIGKWPALFDVANRADRSHVNAVGADLFTRAVAADFVELARRAGASR